MTNPDREEEEVRHAVVAAVAAQIGVEPRQIDPDQPMTSLPGMESVLLLRAIVQIEETCNMSIPDDLLFEPVSANEFARLLASREGVR